MVGVFPTPECRGRGGRADPGGNWLLGQQRMAFQAVSHRVNSAGGHKPKFFQKALHGSRKGTASQAAAKMAATA